MIKILMLILSAITIFILVRYIQCSKWENLIENKKHDFTSKGLVNKQSTRFKQACASLFVVTIGLGFIGLPSGSSKNFVNYDASYEITMEEEMDYLEESKEICNDLAEVNDYDFYLDLWENNSDLNSYTQNYQLEESNYLEVNEPIDSFEIMEDDITYSFEIYEIENKLYVKIDDYIMYNLITRE